MNEGEKSIPSPERLPQRSEMVALHTRMLISGEALNPEKRLEEEIEPENLVNLDQTITAAANSSTKERDNYWKRRWEEMANSDSSLASLDEKQKLEKQKEVWRSLMVERFKAQKNQSLVNKLKAKKTIGEINFEGEFTQEIAAQIYKRYFEAPSQEQVEVIIIKDGEQEKIAIPSNVNQFINDVIDAYQGNLEAIEQDLGAIIFYAGIFGNKMANKVIAEIIRAKLIISDETKKQQLIQQANTQDRRNNLTQTEKIYCQWLFEGSKMERKTTTLSTQSSSIPKPAEPKPQTSTPSLEPEPSEKIEVTHNLSQQNPERFKNNLLRYMKVKYPRLFQLWQFATQKGIISPENFQINPNTWVSEASEKGIKLGTAPMSEGMKYRIIFEDYRFGYEDEVIYRLSHELTHRLLYYWAEKENQQSWVNNLVGSIYNLIEDRQKVFTPLASLTNYQQKGPQLQAQEDVVELINMYLQDPEYLKRYLNFLASDTDEAFQTRQQYGLVKLDKESVENLFNKIQQELDKFLQEINLTTPPTATSSSSPPPDQNSESNNSQLPSWLSEIQKNIEDKAVLWGHGVVKKETVEKILKNGLWAKAQILQTTAIPLEINPQLISALQNWSHLNAPYVVLISAPHIPEDIRKKYKILTNKWTNEVIFCHLIPEDQRLGEEMNEYPYAIPPELIIGYYQKDGTFVPNPSFNLDAGLQKMIAKISSS